MKARQQNQIIKKQKNKFANSRKSITFAPAIRKKKHYRFDSLAQQVEHNTFNVGVLGSSPKRITKEKESYESNSLFFVLILSHFSSGKKH